MSELLRLIIVVDSTADAESLVFELARSGMVVDWRRVGSVEDLRLALIAEQWDAVLVDESAPLLDISDAIKVTRVTDPEMPLIVVAGTVGEERAADTLRSGASDFLLTQNLPRLAAVLEREVRDATHRRERHRSEAEVARLAAIVRSCCDPIVAIDASDRIAVWNPAAERLFGWSAAEAIGQSIGIIPAGSDQPDPFANLRRIAQKDRTEQFETVRYSKSGLPKLVSVSISPVHDEAGSVSDISIIMRDLSPLRQAEAERRLLQSIVEQSSDLIGVVQFDGRFVHINTAGRKLVGLDESAVRQTVIADFLPETFSGSELPGQLAALRSGQVATGRVNVRHLKTGATVPLEWTMYPVTNPETLKTEHLAFLAKDLTVQDCADQARRRIESQYQTLLESIPDPLFVYDRETLRYLFVNNAAISHYGYTREEFALMTLKDIRPPEDVKALEDMLAVAAVNFEKRGLWRHRRKDESIIDVEITTHGLDYMGRPADIVLAHDVTDKLRVVTDLRRSTDLLQAVTDHIPDSVFVKDLSGRYLLFNPAAARATGRLPKDVIDRDDRYLFSDNDARTIAEHDRRVMTTGQTHTCEEELTTPAGVRTFLATKSPFRNAAGEVIGVLGISRDITDRKLVENALRTSEERFRTFMDHSPASAWITDELGRIIYVSETCRTFFRLPEGDLHEMPLEHLFPSQVTDIYLKSIQEVASTGRVLRTVEPALLADSSMGEILVYRFLVPSSLGKPLVGGVAIDITEHRRTENELRLRERAISAASQGIIITDPRLLDNPVVYFSPGAEKTTGYGMDEVIGHNCRFLQGPNTNSAAVARVRELIREGRSGVVTLLNYRKDGSPFWNELSLSPILDDRGELTHFVGIQTDVTQRLALEELLQHSQKMEAIGHLAGGIAHDFNNILTIIFGYAEVAQSSSIVDTELQRQCLQHIIDAGERAASLTRQLLAFSRRQVLEPQVINLNNSIQGLESLLRRLFGEIISLEVDLSSDLWSIKADPSQIEQVLLNLFVNARDAMPQGGRLRIRTENASLEVDDLPPQSEIGPGEYAVVSVQDTGYGIPPDIRGSIFLPYFTTKERGKGTGLGLATVFGIVTQSGGQITVDSEVGKGSLFTVYFPKTDESLYGDYVSSSIDEGVSGGNETILLVEDDAPVRAIAADILSSAGYQVLDAGDATAAMKIADMDRGAIDLLVTDVVMPGMSGGLLADHLKACIPGLRVLYVSGYPDDEIDSHGVLREGIALLRKPFTRHSLERAVRRVLDSKATME